MLFVAPLLLALASSAAPTDPTTWVDGTGRTVSTAVFQPVGGAARPLVKQGRVTAVIVFASWCKPCMAEMPRVIADYKKLKDRVDFLGIDYGDTREASEGVIARFRIPFPVERYEPPEGPMEAHHGKGANLSGTTPKMLPKVMPMLAHLLPDEAVANLEGVAAYCKGKSDADCVAYAKAHEVVLTDPAHPAPAEPPAPAPDAGSAPPSLDLPHAFVIDARGTIASELRGYDTKSDTLAAVLRKLASK